MLLKAKAPHLISVLPAPSLLSQSRDLEPEKVKDVMKVTPTTSNGTFGQSEELRCVIAVLRQYAYPSCDAVLQSSSSVKHYMVFLQGRVLQDLCLFVAQHLLHLALAPCLKQQTLNFCLL